MAKEETDLVQTENTLLASHIEKAQYEIKSMIHVVRNQQVMLYT